MDLKVGVHPYYKWVVVAVIWLIACLNYADRMTVFSVLPVLKKDMGLSDVTLALLGSSFLWVYALCSPLGGYLGDRFSRPRIIIFSLLLFSVVTFATGWARNAFELIALRCLLGVSEAIFLPPALAYIAGYHFEKTRSVANSIALTGLTTGAGFGSWYGGYMSDHFSWRTGFFGLGIAGGVVALAAILILKEHAPPIPNLQIEAPEGMREKARAILRVPTAQVLIFVAFALSLTSWPLHSWLPTYLFENFHLTLTRAGSVVSLYAALPALLGGIAGGVLADRWTRTDRRGRMAIQIIGFSVMAPCMLLLGFIPSAHLIAVDLLIYSVARGMLECNSMPLFCSVVPPNRWSLAYGLYNLGGTLAGSLGIFLVGVLKKTWGIGYTLSAMSLLLFAAVVVLAVTIIRWLTPDIQREAHERLVQPIERR